MAGLFIVRDKSPLETEALLGDAGRQFARHGFGDPNRIRLNGWEALHFEPIAGGPETLLIRENGTVAVAGNIVVDGLTGKDALERLLEMRFPAVDWSRIDGQFVVLVQKHARVFVLADYFAAFQLFHDADFAVLSTSLLAAIGALPSISFSTQGVYEYAFNVVPIGDDTIFSELKTLGAERVLELTRDGPVVHHAPKRPLPLPDTVSLHERLERSRIALLDAAGAQVKAFGGRIHAPLSGGLDSRLVLAALRAVGGKPDVYVYGSTGSPDVAIAQEIGSAVGFQVDWINKFEREQITVDQFPAIVAQNFEEGDALPNYGNIFDGGGNAAARDARHANGWLAASGGCGEIYRNFFYLRDRPITAAAVAKTFFARYALGDVTPMFDEHAFLDAIRDKILSAVGREGDLKPLPRAVIEHVYPRIRCRALFGREISMEARCGAYFMPFLNHHVVNEAMTLPMGLKDAGRFEAMLINAIDPELARQPSCYGHSFDVAPNRHHRASEWSTRMRPIWLRQRSYAFQRRLRPMSDEHGGNLDPAFLGAVIDLELPAMRRFFQIDAITDSGLWRRLACLQYLAERLGAKLVH